MKLVILFVCVSLQMVAMQDGYALQKRRTLPSAQNRSNYEPKLKKACDAADIELHNIMRTLYYNDVPQAHTAHGEPLAYDYSSELDGLKLAPGVIFAETYRVMAVKKIDPDKCAFIQRASNTIIARAFELRDKTLKDNEVADELERAYDMVSQNNQDMSYIVTGKKDITLEPSEIKKSLEDLAEAILNVPLNWPRE